MRDTRLLEAFNWESELERTITGLKKIVVDLELENKDLKCENMLLSELLEDARAREKVDYDKL